MATGGLYGSSGTGALIAQPGSESSGLYGNSTSFGGTYFEWFVFQTSETQPATPTGGTWNFTTNANTPPTGWSSAPPSNPLNTVWVSIAIVNSKNTAALVWSAPGKFAFSSGLPILSDNGAPEPADGQSDQLYIQLNTVPQTIWFKESGTWTRLTGSTLYADLTSNQTIAGTKTFSSQIQGSISGNASNVTGTVAITNGGTGSTTAGSARAALGAAASGANSDITSLSGLTTALSLVQGGTGATTASDARTNLGLGSAAVLTAGAANGVATLDAGGTVPLSQIPASIQGGVSYQGTWNATTNTPTLTSSVGTKGYYYVVSVAGSTNLNGITSWNIGDWAIFNGTAWEKIDNTDAVTSVNGYTGTVVLTQPDISGTASLTTTQTLTNKTLTSPIINFINDTSGNEVLNFSPTASATDFLTVKNGIGVAVPLHVYADGPSANIGLHIQPKGTGLVTISDGTDFNKGIRFRSSGSAASAVTLLDAVATAGRVVTLPDATTTLVGRDTTDTLTNKTINLANNTLTGTASININGTVGATTPNTGAFTTLTTSGAVTHNAGTANGVAYLNGSKVLTTGSALTFDGTNFVLGAGGTSGGFPFTQRVAASASPVNAYRITNGSDATFDFLLQTSLATFGAGLGSLAFTQNGTEGMRLTSTGLGIGTSSPGAKLDVTLSQNGATRTLINNQNSGASAVAGVSLQAYGGGWTIDVPASTTFVNPLQFIFGGTERMRLDSSGNLGIGTSSPTVRLSVATAASTFAATFQGSASTNFVAIGTTSFGASINGYTAGFGAAADLVLQPNGGNLGLGVTPSAWGGGYRAIDVQFGAIANTNAGSVDVAVTQNAFFNGSNWITKYSGQSKRQVLSDAGFVWHLGASQTAGNAISFTQAMTLDASGRLGVGTTSPETRLDTAGEMRGTFNSVNVGGPTAHGISLRNATTTTKALVGGYDIAIGAYLQAVNFGTAYENLILQPQGRQLLVGTTTAGLNTVVSNGGFQTQGASQFNIYSTNSSTQFEWVMRTGTEMQFYVSNASVLARLTASGVWTNASDARYKENIRPVSYGLAELMQLQPRAYNIIGSDKQEIGFVAQEVEPLIPELVESSRNSVTEEDRLTLSYGQLSAVLVKAIQEQQAIITALTARITALESN